jgi:hypothetical protein
VSTSGGDDPFFFVQAGSSNYAFAASGNHLDSWFDVGSTTHVVNNYAGAVFIAVSSVPEPVTWAMMLAGLFGVGALLRCRTIGPALA